MSPIAAGLDGLLAVLLLLALALGLELNGRLKALRQSQAGFAAAVLELNTAAARAEAGLAAIKAASEGAHDDLLARIETARSLATRLERAGAEAERTVRAPASAGGSLRPPGSAMAAIAALAEGRTPAEPHRPAAQASDSARSPAGRSLDDDLFDGRRPGRAGLSSLRTSRGLDR